ncbi:hypothetical protein LOAG_19321, partial [Loa loa]
IPVKCSSNPTTQKETSVLATATQPNRGLLNTRKETSTSAAINQSKSKLITISKRNLTDKRRRQHIFFKKDHQDSECYIYPILKQRVDRLKKIHA